MNAYVLSGYAEYLQVSQPFFGCDTAGITGWKPAILSEAGCPY